MALSCSQFNCEEQWALWALEAPEICFRRIDGRGIFFFEPMCLYSQYSEFCGEIKIDEEHKKGFGVQPNLRTGPWLMGA